MDFAGNSPRSNFFDFCDVPQCEDFSRESLGILGPNYVDLGRESLSFSHEDFGRESLGLMNLSNLEIGRESLAIKAYDFVLSNPLPDVQTPERLSTSGILLKSINEIPVSNITKQVLTPTKCNLSIKKLNALPEVLTPTKHILMNKINEVPELLTPTKSIFDVDSLDFSNIPPILSVLTPTKNVVNSSNITRHLSKLSTSSRGSSSSATSELNKAFLWHPRRGNFLNTSVPARFDEVFVLSPSRQERELQNEKDEIALLEAAHLSWRLGTESHLDEDSLDKTQEPEDFANVIMEEDPVKCDTETVFKNIDKLFIPLPPSTSEKPDSSQSSDKSSGSKSKVAKLVRRLSEIIDTASPTQKNEGQNLLTNLAEMCFSDASTKSRSFSVDYTPSFDSEPPTTDGSHLYEALDLRKSPPDVNSNHIEVQPLDLSAKSQSGSGKQFVSPRMLPPKLNKIHKSVNQSSLSNCSVSSSESRNSSDVKLRSRRPDEKLVTKKGPMRAMLPLDNMAKKSGTLKLTPRTSETRISGYQKKSSTPIKESKPMAQSTPENQKILLPISPLARSNLSQLNQKIKPETSFSSRKSSEGKKQISLLRKSSGDLKKIQNGTKPFVRSHSLMEKSAALTNCNSNVVGNGSVTKENKTKSMKRPSLIRKLGKENAA